MVTLPGSKVTSVLTGWTYLHQCEAIFSIVVGNICTLVVGNILTLEVGNISTVEVNNISTLATVIF